MILGILQARLSSSRLPGKVMAPILGVPMIGRQVERLRRSRRIDRLVIATSLDPSDDVLAAYGREIGLMVVRGPLEDVLGRFITAMDANPECQVAVRLTADCPLTDWRVVDEVIALHLRSGADYTNNTTVRTFPHGLDAEAMRPEALRRAAADAVTSHEREHVTPHLYDTPGRFRTACLTRTPSLADLRWTVDYPEDLAFTRHVYGALLPQRPDFDTADIAALTRNTASGAAPACGGAQHLDDQDQGRA